MAGTFSAVFCKMLYETESVGLDGVTVKPFSKPIMMLLLMFSAMVPAIFMWMGQQAFLEKKDRDELSWRTMAVLMIPSICDLLCTLLLLVAQLYITASMWQMLRGSVIIITAILKRTVLGHRLRAHMWAGIIIIFVAMVLVASTSFFGPGADADADATTKDPRLGVFLVVLGCLAQGVQYVFEEKVMAVDNAPPLVVIGMEGVWGTVLTLVLVYPASQAIPGSDNGSYESFWDSVRMIQNSSQLQALVVGFLITVTVYNCMAVYVTKYLSAIWHAILDNFRPITIWVLDLYIFYVLLPGSGFGEAWVYPGSWVQLGGLLVLFLGTAVYNGSVMECDQGREYESLNGGAEGEGAGLIKTPAAMASPSLVRSPMIYAQQRKAEAAKEAELELKTKAKAGGKSGKGSKGGRYSEA